MKMTPGIFLLIALIVVFVLTGNKQNFFLSPVTGQQEKALLDVAAYYKPHIDVNAARYAIPGNIIAAVIFQESSGNPDKTGLAGEIGLMQITPGALSDVNAAYGLGFLPKDLYFADRNIQTGTAYLSILRNQFGGDIPLALRAYNAGASNVTPAGNAGRMYANSVLSFAILLT